MNKIEEALNAAKEEPHKIKTNNSVGQNSIKDLISIIDELRLKNFSWKEITIWLGKRNLINVKEGSVRRSYLILKGEMNPSNQRKI